MNLPRLQTDPTTFRAELLIDCDGSPRHLGDVLDDWQRDDYMALDGGWKRAAGHKVDGSLRGWLERGRGHSKSSDAMVMATWILFASRGQINGVVAAVDKDQAKLDRDHIDKLVRLNPWLQQILKVDSYKVTNQRTGSTLDVISSDVASSYGLLIDFAVLDEVTLWPKRDLFDSILSASAKRANCLLLCIGNAGFADSWQSELRESIRTDPSWHFSRLDGPVASWITADRLAEQRRLLPEIAYRRLWLNQWTSGSDDALQQHDIDRAVTLPGPLSAPEPGWLYAGGLDLGLTRDKAALAIVAKHVGYYEEKPLPKRKLSRQQKAMIDAGLMDEPQDEPEGIYHPGTGRLKLAKVEVWSPKDSARGKVDIEAVEKTIADDDQRFRLQVGADPWQAAYLIERLQKRGVAIEGVDFVGSNLKSMCSATLEAFNESQLDLYHEPQLIADLKALRVVEKSYGVRLDSPRGPNGHGDTATALAIALHVAKRANAIANSAVNRNILVY